jgi:ABC-type transport system involved in multi-copper enzyme maturation permease subunit
MPAMSSVTRRLGLPLLAKELVELAARRRTYIVRSAYALLLFLAFALFYYARVPQVGARRVSMMGAGRDMFNFMVAIQAIGIYVFLPAMVAGVITYEKERGALELLFLTGLRPWQILFQKLLGRLVPMMTFLLLSLPLLAVAYSFGGIETGHLAFSVYLLFTTCVQVAAFALMISAWCRTGTEATVRTYGGGFLLGVCTSILGGVLMEVSSGRSLAPMLPFLSLAPISILAFQSMPFGPGLPPGSSLLPWAWTVLFLLAARRFLVSRAFLPAKRRKDLFRRLGDLIAGRGRRKRRKGVRRTLTSLPRERPIFWREVALSSLGGPGRFAVTTGLFLAPLLGIAFLLLGLARGDMGTLGFTVSVMSVWVMAALSVGLRSASAFARERTSGTLDLLLVSPMSGRQIVGEKAAVVRRHILLVFVIMAVLCMFEAALETVDWRGYGFGYPWRRRSYDLGPFGYLLTALLAVPVFLSAIDWVARWIGLRCRGRTRATMATLAVLFAWAAGPFTLVGILAVFGGEEELAWLFLLSPATVVFMAELANFANVFYELFDVSAAFPIALSFAVHAAVALVFRHLCLARADRYLGRPVPEGLGPTEAGASAVEAEVGKAGG